MVADLDPQTNASVTMISEERWAEIDKAGQTVARPFSDRLNPNHPPKFDIEESIARGVSTGNRSLRAWRPTWSRTSPAVGSRWGWRWSSSAASGRYGFGRVMRFDVLLSRHSEARSAARKPASLRGVVSRATCA